ncbi:MAG: ABC transporter ATP-binding protein [Oscillospiraceae bacterium]|jgi:putative ABC transport system ATP-binding protein|nr:ABC transporter ATP-binding protein [Oscillospiraceae bacterium]
MATIITLENIGKTYGKGTSAVRALDGVDLNIEEGEFVAILGASGSGKSTLMNIIGLMDEATDGTYYLNGEDVTRGSDARLTKLRGQEIGFIFQKYNLIPKYTVLYNTALPLLLQGMSYAKAKAKATEVLTRVGLAEKLKAHPAELSGGQAQRVAIARALAAEPSLLLADEPTGALDKKTGEEVLAFMRELNEEAGKTIIMITHDLHVATYAKRTIRIEDGRLTGSDRTDNPPL